MASTSFRRLLILTSALGVILFCAPLYAQNVILDTLQSQIDALKKQQAQDKDKQFTQFINEITLAAASPDAALSLLQQAVDNLAAAQVTPNPDGSTPTPRRRRREDQENQQPNPDQAAQDTAKGAMAQAHCGLLRFAALFAKSPDAPHLKEDWMAWLDSAAQNYPALGKGDLADKSMKDSPITKAYGIDFGDKEQGEWTVRKVPELFEKDVLKPLGAANDPRVLDAWNVYANMLQFDQQDDLAKWNNVTVPSLTFKRAVADYKLRPDINKLQNLYTIAKQYPNHPDFNSMLDQVSALLAQLKANYGKPAVATH